MELSCAKISNHADNLMNPGNAAVEMKGQKGVCVLSSGINVPKTGAQPITDKVTGIVVESYMRRPSLSTEAADTIFKFANDSVLVAQSPQYPSFASTSAVFVLKNKFMFACAGDNVIFHFVNGVLKSVFTTARGEEPTPLGNLHYAAPKVSDQIAFGKGTNTFLMCSRKFASSFSESQLESALIRATHTTQKGNKQSSEVKCDRWLGMLWDSIPNRSDADDYSAVAFSLPEKKKSVKGLIIAIIIAIVLAVGIFFLVGALTHPKPGAPGQGGPQPPQAPQQNQDFDYNNMERPTGPNGEVAPDPPTRPPLN